MIDVRDLSVDTGTRRTVRGVSFKIEPGESVCLLGPNGAGKTTLLRSLFGFLGAAGGEILVDGRQLESMTRREIAQRIGYLPQVLPANVGLSVERVVENASYTADRRSDFPTQLESLRKRTIDTLSGGERLRVYFHAALAAQPQILLLDEPLSELDPVSRSQLLRNARRLAQEGLAVLFVTHDISDAIRAATRAIGLRDGQLKFDRPAEDVSADDLEILYGDRPREVSTPHGRFYDFWRPEE